MLEKQLWSLPSPPASPRAPPECLVPSPLHLEPRPQPCTRPTRCHTNRTQAILPSLLALGTLGPGHTQLYFTLSFTYVVLILWTNSVVSFSYVANIP